MVGVDYMSGLADVLGEICNLGIGLREVGVVVPHVEQHPEVFAGQDPGKGHVSRGGAGTAVDRHLDQAVVVGRDGSVGRTGHRDTQDFVALVDGPERLGIGVSRRRPVLVPDLAAGIGRREDVKGRGGRQGHATVDVHVQVRGVVEVGPAWAKHLDGADPAVVDGGPER